MKKKILKGLAVFASLLFIAGAAAYIVFSSNPNLFFKMMAKNLTEGQTVEVAFSYDGYKADESDNESGGIYIDNIPLYKFTPEESTGYTISISDIKCDEAVSLEMSVMDQNLEDYASAENYDGDTDSLTDSFYAETSLQASQLCYILIESSPDDESVKKYSGSFKLSVAKTPEEEGPPEILAGESVTLNVGTSVQAAAVFNPPETGYYRFSTSIDPALKSSGYSMISSVTGPGRQTIGVTDGICRLEKGKEYFVWVSVYETSRKKTEVILSCTGMDTVNTSEKGAVHLTGDTVIKYRPSEAGNIAVYSVSDGDPKALIYEKTGFPLRTDDDTEASLSGNTDDFALAFSTANDGTYMICVYGDFTECTVVITGYTGDGSSLTADDVEPLPEAEEAAPEGEEPGDDGSETETEPGL